MNYPNIEQQDINKLTKTCDNIDMFKIAEMKFFFIHYDEEKQHWFYESFEKQHEYVYNESLVDLLNEIINENIDIVTEFEWSWTPFNRKGQVVKGKEQIKYGYLRIFHQFRMM